MEAVKILIVEDEIIIARNLEMVLNGLEYEVTGIAGTFTEAMASLSGNPPDLVLLDLHLRGAKSGFDVAEEINQRFSMPFIFLTSYADGDTVAKARTLNPSGYLTKPIRQKDLYATIEMALANASPRKIHRSSADGTKEAPSSPIIEGLILNEDIFVKAGMIFKKIPLASILWFKGEGSYTAIHTASERTLVRASLSSLDEAIYGKKFFRVHRSYIVNFDYVQEVHPAAVLVNGEMIPMHKEWRDEVLERLRHF